MLKKCHGQYSENHVQRCAKLGSQLGRSLDNNLRKSLGSKSHVFKKSKFLPNPDVSQAITLYGREKLFTPCPGRKIEVQDVKLDKEISIVKFSKRIIELNEKKDHLRWVQAKNLHKSKV